MPQRSAVSLIFPAAGQYKRMSYQGQPPYTTVSSKNVRADDVLATRERGGSRPGLGKSHATELGSGNPVRLLNTVQYQSTTHVPTVKLIASANGVLYQESAASTMSAVTSDLTLASDRVLQSTDRQGNLYIADDGSAIEEASDGAIASNGTSFTSATAGDFAAGGVDEDDMLLVITEHDGIDAVQTITISGSPTGGTWRARFGDYSTDPLDYNISAANLEDALEALTSIGIGNVTVSGTAPYTVTFAGDLGDQPIELITVDDSDLTGGTSPSIAVANSTVGSTTTRYAGSWQIASIATTTITLTKTLRQLTGIAFRIQRSPKVYSGSANTLTLHLTDDDAEGEPLGFVPVGRSLVTMWRDRIIYAGGKYTPHVFEMSRQGDPADFDYGADPQDVGRAVIGTLADAGELGEPITALIPHDQVCLIFGCSTSLWICRGDPAYGGQIDNLSHEIGVVSANAWCYTPDGYLFFLSKDGLYMMGPGCGSTPVSVSRERLPEELISVDTSAYTVSMAYDVRDRGIHLFVTKNTAATAAHWWIDVKLTMHGDATNASFWPVELADTDYDPFICHGRKNYTSDYSWVILGGRDGYLRRFRSNLGADDGTNFESYVDYGPIRLSSNDFVEGVAYDLVGNVASGSGDVAAAVRTGETMEEAFNATAGETVYWRTAGLQYTHTVRRHGRAAFVRISNGEDGSRWAIEGLMLTRGDGGRQRKV